MSYEYSVATKIVRSKMRWQEREPERRQHEEDLQAWKTEARPSARLHASPLGAQRDKE